MPVMRTNGIFDPDGDQDADERLETVRDFYGSHRCKVESARDGNQEGRRIFWNGPVESTGRAERLGPRLKRESTRSEKIAGLERMRQWRAAKREGGWCGRCGKRKREQGRSNCAVCREYGTKRAALRQGARLDV